MSAPFLEMAFYESLRSPEAYADWLKGHPQEQGRIYGHQYWGEARGSLALHVLLGYLGAVGAIQKEIDLSARLAQTPAFLKPWSEEEDSNRLTQDDLTTITALQRPDVPWGPEQASALDRLFEAWDGWGIRRRELDALWSEALIQVNEGKGPLRQRQIAAEKTSVAYQNGVLLFRNVPELKLWRAALADRPGRVMEVLLTMPPREHLLKDPGPASVQVNAACQEVMVWAIQSLASPSEDQQVQLAQRYPAAWDALRARDRHADLLQRAPASPARPRRRS